MVKYLSIKDGKKTKKLPIRISYYMLKKLKEKHNVDFDQIGEDMSFDVYESMLFYALEKGHKVDGQEFTYKIEDMEELMDQVFFEFINMIPQFFPAVDTKTTIKTLPEKK